MAESEILADLVGEPQHLVGRRAQEPQRDVAQAGPNLSSAAQVLVPPAPRKLEDRSAAAQR